MKVLDLGCTQGHTFEGWFGSEDDFLSQQQRGLLTCPLCGDAQISKRLSAPRLNLSGARPDKEPVLPAERSRGSTSKDSPKGSPAGDKPVETGATKPPVPARGSEHAAAGVPAELQALWLKAVQQVVARTEDVGERFPEEARRIHYGEAPHRGIRGQASPEEREALAEEGIDVVPLPMPPGLKGPVQ